MGLANTEVGWRAPSGSSLIMVKNPRPGLPTTTVVQNDRGYYRLRVPKALAAGHEMAGVTVEWTIESGNALRAEVVDVDEE